MREILFRGKRVDNGEWMYGYLVIADERYFIATYPECITSLYYPDDIYAFTSFVEVIPSTVGQFTGLTDKNGARIFEEDIIKHFNHFDKPDEYAIYKVEFDEKICKFSGRLHKQWSAQLSKDLEKRYEVIGNIHDNPELLKGGVDNG